MMLRVNDYWQKSCIHVSYGHQIQPEFTLLRIKRYVGGPWRTLRDDSYGSLTQQPRRWIAEGTIVPDNKAG